MAAMSGSGGVVGDGVLGDCVMTLWRGGMAWWDGGGGGMWWHVVA